MLNRQMISDPLGINVFGSATIRVAPDIAVITFTATSTQSTPRKAFSSTREISQKIQTYLSTAKIREAGVSQVHLSEAYVTTNGVSKLVGYHATTTFRVILRDVTQLVSLLEGVIGAGASRIQSTSFQTTQLKELRIEARRKAVLAAREKAEQYCAVAGVKLGKVIHIEDTNPDMQQQASRGHVSSGESLDDEQGVQAFDPSSIVVAGAVIMTFTIEE